MIPIALVSRTENKEKKSYLQWIKINYFKINRSQRIKKYFKGLPHQGTHNGFAKAT